jgi:hypothetical protein
LLLAAAVVVLFSLPLFTRGYESGPPPAMTGGFGESNCRECHFDHALNDARYTLFLEGLPDRYESGRKYILTVRLEPAPRAGGFELSARFADGPRQGAQAGLLQSTGEFVQIVELSAPPAQEADEAPQRSSAPFSQSPLLYAQHTLLGNRPGPKGWTVVWTAPQTAASPVVLNVAANAADGDTSPLGDFIYTVEHVLVP